MAWFLKRYKCEDCGTVWTDEWSCACNDRCRKCRAETETDDYDDLSIIVRQGDDLAGWIVMVSPNSAEDKPCYAETFFRTREEAEDFAESEEIRLERERRPPSPTPPPSASPP
jgi:hypothetical protein